MKLKCLLFGCKVYMAESEIKVDGDTTTFTNYCYRCGKKYVIAIHRGISLKSEVEE